ncbi:MAG: 3-hydroxyacyl-CoA dehydrogenase family protein [Bacteroidota bacterium]
MKIVIAAGDILKQEMLDKPNINGAEFTWMDNIETAAFDSDAYFDLNFIATPRRIQFLKRLLPKPVFINSVEYTLSETDPSFIRINAWPTFLQRKVCEVCAGDAQKKNVSRVFDFLGWHYQFVSDVCGMISARIVAMIINEAYYTLEEKVSTKNEIDIAMKSGTNYPYGPFEWSEKIGLKNIYSLLLALSKTASCYTISGALKKEIS